MEIKEILQEGINKLKQNQIKEPILKSRLLLAYTLKVEKEYLLTHDNLEVDNYDYDTFLKYMQMLIDGTPLQYITNKQEFMKLEFYVDENVLIPRQDTEVLVEEVINYCNEKKKNEYEILDLCTGSGAIGIALAKYINNSKILCSDISKKALEVVEKNAKINKVNNINFICSDMFEQINKKFDIIVSNPPYIKNSVIPLLDKEVQSEPHIALDGGEDGLKFYKIIIEDSSKYLKNSGILFMEIGYDQKDNVVELLKESKKYTDIYTKNDLYGNNRVVIAKLCS